VQPGTSSYVCRSAEAKQRTDAETIQALVATLFVMEFIHRLLFKSLKNLETLKIITFRRMDLHSSSGKKGQTPIVLDPVDRAIPDLWTSVYRIQHNRCLPFLPEDE
jgi:hypothetical protein